MNKLVRYIVYQVVINAIKKNKTGGREEKKKKNTERGDETCWRRRTCNFK